MKKLLLAIGFTGMLSLSLFAQVGAGLRVGYGGSISSQELVNGMTREIGFSPVFGVMFDYDLDLHFAAGVEANYVTFTESITYSKDFYPGDASEKRALTSKSVINYIQIPVFGRVNFGDKKNKIFISFGPYLGIGLSGKRENAMPKIGLVKVPEFNFDAEFNEGDFSRFDLGGQLGAGVQRTVGKSGILFLEARFQLGFFDLYNTVTPDQRESYLGSNKGNGYSIPGATWRAANVSIGYLHTFKLPKKNSSSGGVKKAGKQKR